MLASPVITPALRLTTSWAASNAPITIFHVLETIRMAQAVLKIQRKNIQLSTSWRLLRSVTI
jgi:hypothetical protein